MNITEYFPEYREVGYAKKSYGVNGHIRVFIEDEFDLSIEKADHCFFLLKGCLVPYFIEKSDQGLIKFESCNSPEDTKTIVSRAIYLHEDQLISKKEKVDENSFSIFIGFDLVDAESEEFVGSIADVIEYPQQEIALVKDEEKEFLIPLNIYNVKAINQEEQLIFVEIPEGLLDLS